MRQLLFVLVVSISLLPALNRVDAQEAREIRIGQPKAWRYDRMFPVEDGLLRDVEGINISSLTGLDASGLNSRVVDLLQTYISASVNFDQTAGIQNAIAMDAFHATRGAQFSQLKDQAATSQALADQKAEIAKALVKAIADQTSAKQAGCQPQKTCDDAQKKVDDLNAQLKAINDASTAVGTTSLTPPNGPSVNGVSGGTPITTPALTPLLPATDFVKNALTADPSNLVGSLPARERLQNFITLLNDRLTHQLALSLDERGLSNDYVPVVLELDVAIEPNANRKEQKAVSVFTLDGGQDCNGKKPVVYNLYPSLAAFNVSEVQGQSSGFYANGAFKGLFLGSNISYQRQHDHIMSAMAQSVYISGFRQSDNVFGWYYGAPAYSKLVRPGIYTTFAVVLIPKRAGGGQDEDNVCKIQLDGATHWEKKNGKESSVTQFNNLIDAAAAPILPDNHPPLVRQVQYWPHYGRKSDLQRDMNVVAIEFEQPVDPNLLITASGKLLKRVRDWRGRATSPSTNDTVSVNDAAGNAHPISIGRGLLESNYDEADTWIAVSQKRILIKLGYGTAGPSDFPSVRLLIPGAGDTDLRDAVDYASYASRVSIGDREFYACHPKLVNYDPRTGNEGCMRQPNSMWLPMFIETPEKNHRLRVVKVRAAEENANDAVVTTKDSSTDSSARLLNAAMRINASTRDEAAAEGNPAEVVQFDAPDNSGNGQQQYIFLSLDDGRMRLSPGAQVLLVAPAHSRFAHPMPMECAPLGSGLLCHLHPQAITFNTPKPSGLTQVQQVGNAGTPQNQAGHPDVTNPEAGLENAPCLFSHSDQDKKDGKARVERNLKNRFCDWRNYRLQVVVTQTSNEAETAPTIFAAADFPTGENTLPIIGLARSAQLAGDSWKIVFPVWYGARFISKAAPLSTGAAKPGQPEQLCVGNETGERVQNLSTSLAADPLGDSNRAGVLTVTAPKNELSTIVFSRLFLYNDCASPTAAVQLGALSGVERLILPDNLLLTKAGSNSSFYQFTGTNSDRVRDVIFGNNTHRTPNPVRGGFVVDLSPGSARSATKQKPSPSEPKPSSAKPNSAAGTKAVQESLLYFEVGGLQVPAIACSNTGEDTPKVCGQLVVSTPPSGPATIEAVQVENLPTAKNPASETPAAKISVRPD
jgi:hypothetical protein